MDPKNLNSYVGVVNQPPPKWSSVKKWLLHINYAPGYAPEPEEKPVCRQFSRCEGCPYHATEGYYQNIGEDGFTERDHIRLRDALLSMEGKFLLSYNDDAFIRGLYDAPGIQIEPVTRLNNIRQRYDPNCQFSELLIANYDMAERAHATTQINLFDFQKGEFDETYVF